jgi:hypothetical protein
MLILSGLDEPLLRLVSHLHDLTNGSFVTFVDLAKGRFVKITTVLVDLGRNLRLHGLSFGVAQLDDKRGVAPSLWPSLS